MKMFDVYKIFDVTLVKGKDAYVYDNHDKKYLDFYGGHAVISIGHSHPHYVEVLKNQIDNLIFYSNSIDNPLQDRLAKKLAAVSGIDGYDLFLINSGAEANENALKLASFQNGRTKIIAFKKGFHGRTSAAVRATDNPKIQAALNKGFEVEYHDLNDTENVQATLAKGDVCAIILEAIQGIGGMNCADPQFLESISASCKEYDTALILDEVQAGFGRSGQFFAYEVANIQPDIITMAKGMGNGFPIGGLLISNKKYKAKPGLLGTTYGGNHLACAASQAVLEVIEQEQLMENAIIRGKQIKETVLALPGVKQVKGRGLMLGVEFDFPIADLRKQLVFEEQLFTGSASNPNMIRLLPPLNITEEHVAEFTSKFKKGITSFLKLKSITV